MSRRTRACAVLLWLAVISTPTIASAETLSWTIKRHTTDYLNLLNEKRTLGYDVSAVTRIVRRAQAAKSKGDLETCLRLLKDAELTLRKCDLPLKNDPRVPHDCRSLC